MRSMLFLSLLTLALAAGVPTIDELLQYKTARGAVISPDGKFVAHSVTETDWEQDAFVTHLWLAETAGGRARQLTRGKKSESSPAWSPNGQWLAFTSDREGGKNQIFAMRPDGGEAVQLTKSEAGAQGFEWSPDGAQIAYTAADKRGEERK